MPAVFESILSPHFRFNPCDLTRRTAYHIPSQAARRPWVYNPTTHSTVALPVAVADLGHQSQVQQSSASYNYNADGTVARKTDANGNTELYTSDRVVIITRRRLLYL